MWQVMMQAPARRLRRRLLAIVLALVACAALLAIPPTDTTAPPAPTGRGAFAWNRDAAWTSLEAEFRSARAAGCGTPGRIDDRVDDLMDRTDQLEHADALGPAAAVFDSLEVEVFATGAVVAACPDRLPDYLAATTALRRHVKAQSSAWDMSDRVVRDRLYRALYGTRAAVEEVLLQHPAAQFALYLGPESPSATPSAVVQGVTLHSGDLLVSRGGYPTSALIARGSDYPGNFSHVALVHVEAATGVVSVIEAHIERGVAVATAAEYLADKKLRILVLRPRADLPALQRDPLLPHRAASAMLDRTRAEHIPYDFAMDYRDPSRLFCSEVASAAYATQGLTLWTGSSTITAPGLRRWLGGFGVTHFETQEPSDLEYDPQLVIVAEWRDLGALRRDHIDNAVTDAMLEGAELGDAIPVRWWQLPAARLMKGYSIVREALGGFGPIPEGMSAAAALRNRAYTTRHQQLATVVDAAAAAWQVDQGYPPPYWVLVELARDAVAAETR